MLRCLIIDNYDSFTWNLQQDVISQLGCEPLVLRNDELSWKQLKADLAQFDCAIISPGPGRPDCLQDLGLSYHIAKQDQLPLLGVCLGFQTLLQQSGATIFADNDPYHGRTSLVHHTQQDLLADIPTPFSVVRYHSLRANLDLPEDWILQGQTETGVPMVISHKRLAKWAVQFHPESILTEFGQQIMANFAKLVHKKKLQQSYIPKPDIAKASYIAPLPTKQVKLIGIKLDLAVTPEQVFTQLYAKQQNAFWLDSADNSTQANFSFMGAVADSEVFSYKITTDDSQLTQGSDYLTRLDNMLQDFTVTSDLPLPFAFKGGLVGFFGYEMKALCGGDVGHHNPYSDACWLQVKRFIAYDKQRQQYWLLALELDGENSAQWLQQTKQQLLTLGVNKLAEKTNLSALKSSAIKADFSAQDYQQAIAKCVEQIKQGNSYEVCLTNRFSLKQPTVSALALYQQLRKNNPAPYAAYIQLKDLHILSSSPELFLDCDINGMVTSKPIKGTIARQSDWQADCLAAKWLQQSEKNRAENLMIVDLMRNDFAQVCQSGSITVPQLMQIESYATLHQLVSTVCGKIKAQVGLIELVKACFPAGSITGAPKVRTMQIIDEVERSARGVYCGAIGYLGYNKVAQLNVAIRTIALHKQQLIVGAGGAITYLSDAQEETEEVILKANAVLQSILAIK